MTETTVSATSGTTASRGHTIARLWLDAVAEGRDGAGYLVEEEPGTWREVSWAEAARAVDEIAHGLLALGLRKGDAFAILASTRLEWALFDFALGLVAGLGALRARGREHSRSHPEAVEEVAASIDEDDLFTFIYTSGTTGPPKACMIRHRNYYAMVEKGAAVGEAVMRKGDVMLLYLPLAHNYGRLLHLAAPYVGYTVAFLPDPLRAAEELPRVRPTLFPSVPRVYEKVHAAVVAKFDQETGIKRRIADWSLE